MVNVQCIIDHVDDWNSIVNFSMNNNKLFVSCNQGITLIELASYESQVVFKSQRARCTVAPYQRGILFTDQVQASSRWVGRIEFRYLLEPRLKEAKIVLLWNVNWSTNRLCVEFDSVVYIYDAQSNSLKIITPFSETGRFLNSVGKLYDAFAVHKKGQSPQLKTLSEAPEKVKECSNQQRWQKCFAYCMYQFQMIAGSSLFFPVIHIKYVVFMSLWPRTIKILISN